MVGWLLVFLVVLSLADPAFAKHFVDPLVYWSSRLFVQQ
jgi:hypothetical protein